MDKDYTLLSPFDPEKAKAGEAICYVQNGEHRKYIAGPDVNGDVVISKPDGAMFVNHASAYRMAPLCWIEDKPVYRGDVLYRKIPGTNEIQELTVQNIEKTYGDLFIRFDPVYSEFADDRRQCLSWTKPKQKKQGWINVYPKKRSYWYPTKEKADQMAGVGRITCIPFEYEE